MKDRIKVLMNKLPINDEGKEISAVLVTSYTNRLYFTKFSSSSGYLLVTNKRAYYLVDFRYYESAKRDICGAEVLLLDKLSIDIKKILVDNGIKTLAIENEGITLSLTKDIESIVKSGGVFLSKGRGLDDIIKSMRIIKSPEEIEKIRTGQKIAEQALKHTLKSISAGQAEKDIAVQLEFSMRKNGAECVSFDLIVLSGENSSVPHGKPSNRMIKNGDLVLIDMGAVFEGYRSDMTRTIAVGSVSEKMKAVYKTVYAAQIEALKAIKPGVTCGSVDARARDVIDNGEYRDLFGHALGHGVGLDIHEEPRLSAESETILQAGMVITVEPGIYISGEFGVRIEDMVVVRKEGYENLTFMEKDLIVI